MIISLLVILSFFQNCGQVGLLPGQSGVGFESNGGGYSGIKGASGSLTGEKPDEDKITRDPIVTVNDGCSGKVQVYKEISTSSCDLTGYTQNDFLASLTDSILVVADERLALPVSNEMGCSLFQKKYTLIINSCDAKLKVVQRSRMSFEATAGQVIIDGVFYEPFGIFNIKLD